MPRSSSLRVRPHACHLSYAPLHDCRRTTIVFLVSPLLTFTISKGGLKYFFFLSKIREFWFSVLCCGPEFRFLRLPRHDPAREVVAQLKIAAVHGQYPSLEFHFDVIVAGTSRS